MDIIGYPLLEAEARLQAAKLSYTMEKTVPTRDFFKVDDSQLYVVRQKLNATGEMQIVVAAKMRKEVS